MPLFTILMLIVIIASLVFCALTTWRVFYYNKKYHLPESKYTKLFGVIAKEHVTIFYIFIMIAYAVLMVWFTMTL